MVKILFICHGNICRSPIAEFVLKDKVAKLGIADQFTIASCATSTEEIWGDVAIRYIHRQEKNSQGMVLTVPENTQCSFKNPIMINTSIYYVWTA